MTAGLARDAAARRRDYEAWLQRMAGAGHGADFYQVLRRIDAAHPDKPRLGQGLRPGDEAVRIVQPADLTFAPTPVAGIRVPPGGGAVHLRQRIFGLIGPNGALPIHLTELARERAHHHGDHALQRFLDMLAQRFAVLFYRAWADAQPLLSMDRGGDTAFARRLGALVGIGEDSLLARDAAGDAAKLHFAGRLSRQVRDADGLQNWCRVEFDVPVQVQQWQGHWMPLGVGERTRLGRRAGHELGRGAVLGTQAWDVQHKFRIVAGPMHLDRFESFLPEGGQLERIRALVRQWVGQEFEWDLQLVLARDDVPRLRLGGRGRLGRNSWLGRWRRPHDAADVLLVPERMKRRHAAVA